MMILALTGNFAVTGQVFRGSRGQSTLIPDKEPGRQCRPGSHLTTMQHRQKHEACLTAKTAST
jgi:hypothetical protein